MRECLSWSKGEGDEDRKSAVTHCGVHNIKYVQWYVQ